MLRLNSRRCDTLRHTSRESRVLHPQGLVFFFNDTEPTEIYTVRNTLSLHDALPISPSAPWRSRSSSARVCATAASSAPGAVARSEEHTSELQSLRTISYAVFCL